MKLGILQTYNHRLLSVAAMLDVFDAVNRFYKGDGSEAFFEIEFVHVGQLTATAVYEGYTIKSTDENVSYDLILIPAFKSDLLLLAVASNRAFIPWMQKQYNSGAAIASFCTGAFLLAASGLLNNRPATTHINAGHAFANAFPDVIVTSESIVTEKDRIYTSGGALNSFHLMFRLLEVYCSREIAVRAAKVFSIDMERKQQKYFGTFSPAENHGDDLVKQVQQGIKMKYRDANTIEELITNIPSSRRNLVRRFKQATGFTPIEYLQKTRMEAAKQLLEHSRQSVTEVMLESGYNDFKSFRLIFKKNVGMTPTAYRKKFNLTR